MARKLKGIEPTEIKPSKPKILIFGEGGVGKTHFALQFPSVYYFDHEGGATRSQYVSLLRESGGRYFGRDEGALSFESVLEEIETLATTEHPYKTVVFDSFTKLYNTHISQTEEEMRKLNKKVEFSIEKKPAINLTRRLLRWLDRLDMNVIIICHEKAKWEGGEQHGYTFDAWDKLNYELDLSLRVTLIGADGRKAKITKSRVSTMPVTQTLDWSFDEFANRYGRDVIFEAVVPFAPATEDQIGQLKSYVEDLQWNEERVTKLLSKATPPAEAFEEISEKQASEWIARMASALEAKKQERIV